MNIFVQSLFFLSNVPEPPGSHCQQEFSCNKEQLNHHSAEDPPTRSHQLDSEHKAALEDSNLIFRRELKVILNLAQLTHLAHGCDEHEDTEADQVGRIGSSDACH